MIKYQGDKTDATALIAYVQSLEDRLDFAEFEWNRATAGMQERDAEIARLQEAKRRALDIADERAKEANELRAELELLRHGLKEIVDFADPLPRAVVREACAELLREKPKP